MPFSKKKQLYGSVSRRISTTMNVEAPQTVTYFVGAGSLPDSDPPPSGYQPYLFYDSNQNQISPSSIVLTSGVRYIFRRLDNATSHPFFISSGGVNQPNDNSVVRIQSSANYQNGITGSQTLQLEILQPESLSSGLSYYCTSHPNRMQGTFRVQA